MFKVARNGFPQATVGFQWKKDYHTVARYPEIKNLMGSDPSFKYQILFLIFIQLSLAYLIRDVSWTTLFLAAYFIGAIPTHGLVVGVHDISHNIPFGNGKPLHNRLFGILANLPTGIPSSIAFKKYHILHHRYMGVDEVDPDLPTTFETRVFCNSITKLVWVILQPALYALRPIFTNPMTPCTLEILNIVVQFIFDYMVVQFWGWKSLVFMVASVLLGTGLHPLAGHFIAEHYMFERGYETYSYYGPGNWLTFNVGYHNEHHDFPSIPGSKLPLVKKIAAEYYDNLPHHTSWTKVIWDFITDPRVGPYARVKRPQSSKININNLNQE
ncbi:sphingolipid delta(4)-desaturase DES1-like isoform X3 [Montipora capricornis]|uniref:sphingolipid delta(4)-desaturase DES1-like isoform X3 n=1 Tax=Montipora capricornis TaxID=246305 RepID=UPI0035F13B19